MLILRKDFNYLESLYMKLDHATRQRFLHLLVTFVAKRTGWMILSFEVIGEEILRNRVIDRSLLINKTVIRKAYRASKEK